VEVVIRSADSFEARVIGGPAGKSVVSVGGLELPGDLLEAIGGGRWKAPKDVDRIKDIFGDEPDWPQFYDLASITRQNQFFQNRSLVELDEDVPGSSRGLGVDPALAVLIGDLGADMPIALDYRPSRNNPRVIYLADDGWREVAPDFEMLCRRLGL
jgi:hypothetical protein